MASTNNDFLCLLMSYLLYKMSGHHRLTEPELKSSNVFFCRINLPKDKNNSVNAKISHFLGVCGKTCRTAGDNRRVRLLIYHLHPEAACVNGLLPSHSEDSCEDMSCGEDSPCGSPGSDGEGAFFLSTFLHRKK